MRDEVGANAKAELDRLKAEAERLAVEAAALARAAIRNEAGRHTRGFVGAIKAQTQIDLSAILADDDLTDYLAIRSEEFNGLIRNLSTDVLQRIERETLGSIFQGRSNADVARSLRGIDGIGRNRSKLIARDQASKLNGAMNQFRQQQVGVTHYKWKTILDGRERPSHHANNGKVFAWVDPPKTTGHPGHDINCRCRALAIITDDPEEIDASATPGGEAPDDLGDFFVQNLSAIRNVAAVPRINVPSTLSAGDIAERLAQSVDLQRKLAAVGKSFTEKHAEQLVVELFGFMPKQADLESLSPSRIRAVFSSRRSVLISASNERLGLIERTLRNAKIRPPSR